MLFLSYPERAWLGVLSQDLLCHFGTHKGFGLGIALDDVRVNRRNQRRDTAKHATTNLFGRQVSKDTCHQIEPRTTGVRDMHVDARVAHQPPPNRRVFMRGVIVGDQMEGFGREDLAINQTKERQPFLVPMARPAGGDDRAFGNIQGGKEHGGAMPLVVVRHRAAATVLEGQAGLGAIQGLDLAFLIHVKDHGMLRRVQIQAHHVLRFVLKVWIPTELKGPDSVGCKPWAVQTRCTNVGFVRRCRVKMQVDQWVAEGDVVRVVVFRLRAMSAWRALGGRPTRGASWAMPDRQSAATRGPRGSPTRVQSGGNMLVVVACGGQSRLVV